MSEGYQLPDKWSEDAVDENGNKLSKRYINCRAVLQALSLLSSSSFRQCSEWKKREKAQRVQKERAEKKV